jgi:hypothetical protein
VSVNDLNAVVSRIAIDTKFVGQLMEDFPGAIEKNGYVLDDAEIDEARASFDKSGSPLGSSSAHPNLLLPPNFPAAPNIPPNMPIDPDAKARQKEMGDFTLSLLKGTLNNAKLTYQLITLMNAIMFCMGVGLFLFAAVYGALSRNLTFTAAFAGLGAASFVALFMLGPIDKTQDALSNLIQAEVAFMNYFDQMCFLEAFAQCPAPGTYLPCVPNLERASALLQQRTRETLDLLQTYLENRPTKTGEKQDGDRGSRARRTNTATTAAARRAATQTSSTET